MSLKNIRVKTITLRISCNYVLYFTVTVVQHYTPAHIYIWVFFIIIYMLLFEGYQDSYVSSCLVKNITTSYKSNIVDMQLELHHWYQDSDRFKHCSEINQLSYSSVSYTSAIYTRLTGCLQYILKLETVHTKVWERAHLRHNNCETSMLVPTVGSSLVSRHDSSLEMYNYV
jgi:hypothetical protein